MKKSLIFVLSVITLIACNGGVDTLPWELVKSYIGRFIDCEVIKVTSKSTDMYYDRLPEGIDRETIFLDIVGRYVSDHGYYQPGKTYIYYEYLNQIGDTCFNKMMPFGNSPVHDAITVPLQTISITCDRDFNSDFPAGAELNGLFNVWFDDYYAVVKNGYKRPKGSYYYGKTDTWEDLTYFQNYPVFYEKLSEVNFPERPFIGSQWACYLVVAPDQTGEYTFHVKVTLDDGKEMEATALPVLVKGR